jgi:hypothetical protein
VAWGYRSTAGDDEPETPDYSGTHDYSSDEPDYSSMSDEELAGQARNHPDQEGLRQDILPDDYKRKGFKDNFRDKYRENMKALDGAEKGAAKSSKPGGRDIGKQERSTKEPAWKTNLEAKRNAAQVAAKNKKNSFLIRNKNKVIVAAVGLLVSAGMSIFMLPGIAIAEFGQIANWIKQTTQTVHEITTGARSARNMVRSATVAARAAVTAGVRSHFQMSRVGTFGEMVGRNYLDKLGKSGVHFGESKLLGVYDGLSIDADALMGNDRFKLLDPNEPGIDRRTQINRQNAFDRAKPQMEARVKDLGLDGMVDITPDGINTKPGVKMSYRDTLKLMRAVDNATGTSKFRLSQEIKIRYTTRMLGINSWLHPIEKLKGMGRDKIREWHKAAKEKKAAKVTSDAMATDAEPERDTNGDEVRDGENDSDKTKERKKKVKAVKDSAPKGTGKTRAKITPKMIGGIAGAAAGVLLLGICTSLTAAHALLENLYETTTTMGSIQQDTVSTWGQIQSAFLGLDNEGIDMDVLAELHKDLYDDEIPEVYQVDEEGYIVEGSITEYTSRGWTGAPAYQATANDNVISKDRVPPEVVEMYEAGGGWSAKVGQWLDTIPVAGDLLKGLCNAMDGWVGAVLDVFDPATWLIKGIDIVSGGAATEAISNIMSFVFQLSTGIMLDDAALDPDQRAEVAYRASEYVMNSNFASEGAGEIPDSEAYENQLIAQEWLDAEWQARPLADRLFDATDYRSTIARVVNGAGINTMPSNIGEHFANWAKLIGAVPNFISGGLFNNKSAEAKAASSSYDTGAPNVELTAEFMDKITGGDEDWDYDVNAEKVFDLLGETGTDTDYHDYARNCLGLEIGSGPEYKVTAIESDDPEKALLVGFSKAEVGLWYKNDCASLANDENHQRVALYAGLDYPILAGYAWYGTADDDPEAQKIAKELGFDDGNNSGSDGPQCYTGSSVVSQITVGHEGGAAKDIVACAVDGTRSQGQEPIFAEARFKGTMAIGEARLVVNSEASTAAVKLAAAYKEATGNEFIGTYSYRSYEEQDYIDKNLACKNGYSCEVAEAGTSNHEMGFAIDVVSPNDAVYQWMMQCKAGNLDGENDGLCYGWKVGFISGDLRHAELDPKFRVKVGDGGNTSLDYDSLLAKFIEDTNGSGDYDGAYGQQCFDIPVWFLAEYTTLGSSRSSFHGKGNAKDLVQAAVNMFPELTISSEPRSPGIFSSKTKGVWGASSTACDGVCGHTGLIIDVKDNGDGTKTVTTMEGWSGASPIGKKQTQTWSSSLSSSLDFVYLGDVLK